MLAPVGCPQWEEVPAHEDEVNIHISSVSSTYNPDNFASDLNNLNIYSKYKISVGSTNNDENMTDDMFKTMKHRLILMLHMLKHQMSVIVNHIAKVLKIDLNMAEKTL